MSERGGVLQGNFIENFRINTSFVKHRKITFRLHFLYMLSQFQKTSYFYVLYRLLYFRRNFYQRLSKAVYMTQWSVPTESSILSLPSNYFYILWICHPAYSSVSPDITFRVSQTPHCLTLYGVRLLAG